MMVCQIGTREVGQGVPPDPPFERVEIPWCLTHDVPPDSKPCLLERIAELEAALREIAGTYEETPQTPTKLCAALYAVSRLAAHALSKSDQK